MKGKIEWFLSEGNINNIDVDRCIPAVKVRLKRCTQSHTVCGMEACKDLCRRDSKVTSLGEDMLCVFSPNGLVIHLIDQRGNCKDILLSTKEDKITAMGDGFIKIEASSNGRCRYYDRLFRESEQPTEFGKILYKYDMEEVKAEAVIESYFKDVYKQDSKDVIKNKMIKFILNEEKSRAIREIDAMDDVSEDYVQGVADKIAGIEAYLKLNQEKLQKREAAKKAISSISFDNKF